MAAALHLPLPLLQPRTRGDCPGQRPCPHGACRMHLPRIEARRQASGRELPPESVDSCALDVADRGSHSLAETALRLNVTRSRVQQLERYALARARQSAERFGIDFFELVASWDSVRG
jgi:hypothetical protein